MGVVLYYFSWYQAQTDKTQVMPQDNIEMPLLATGAPVSACVVLLSNDEIRTIKQVVNILYE